MNTIDKAQNNLGKVTAEARLKELEEDNLLLIDQLHVVQTELERLHYEAPSQARQLPGSVTLDWVDDQLPEAIAESLRCRAILDTQKKVQQLEAQHALASKLGDILIQATNSPASLLAAPSRLLGVWRQEKKKVPPSELGGKGFDKIIVAYREGGLIAVEDLLASVSMSSSMQANALTAVARSLMQREPVRAAELARRAYAIEPRPFRLKWLAFRLHEAGERLEAEAMLEALPSDMQFSDSEVRQASRLRNEAKQTRMREAEQKCSYSERRAELARQVIGLTRAREEQAAVAAQCRSEIEALRQAMARLEGENVRLTRERGEQVALAGQRLGEVEALRQAMARLEGENVGLTRERGEQIVLVELQRSEIGALRHAKAQLEQENVGLTQERDAQVALAGLEQGEIEALRRTMARLEQENVGLTQARNEQAVLAAQRQGELLQLTRTQVALEREKSVLELRQRELEQFMGACNEQTKQVVQKIQDLASTLTQRNGAVDDQFKKQSDSLVQMRKYLDSAFKNEIANSIKQTQAFIGLQSYYATGELPELSCERNSWPVSQDFALYLVELVETNNYDLIIEFGSGISTVVVAKALTKALLCRQGRNATRLVSFDHLDRYYQQTRSRLVQVGLEDAVQLVLAPLQDWQATNGETYPYYSCEFELTALAQKHAGIDLRMLVIVDGPPASTGKHARYPAAPLLLQHFTEAHIDILLDDYIRDDEKEIAQLWQAEMQAAGREYGTKELKFEKDAYLISVAPLKRQ